MNEVDPKLLSRRLARFLAHSEFRLQKMLAGFSDQQADYIRILPLFFHINHPLLPGFIETEVSAGIPGYQPSKVDLQIARGISKSFHFSGRAHLQFDILGLFLMGSTGSVGQAAGSDLDCWLALRPSLDGRANRRLQQKCEKLSQWFAGKGVELNCYLVACDDFSQGRLPKLLLDEFYRTAVWLAGRKPLWWLVDDDQLHQAQTQRWINERHLDAADWLDFGPVAPFVAEEFLQAALGQLLKAMSSPFKSVIKLTLLEVYAQQFPEVKPLSQVYKNALLAGTPQEELDPYLILYQYLAERLTASPRRIAFLQKSLYLKSAIKLTKTLPKRAGWRWQLMARLVSEWGLSKHTIEHLNRRQQWSVADIRKIRRELLTMLNQSYHFLNDFSRIHGIASLSIRQKILTIGRQLYVAFEEKENKISCINQGIVPLEQTVELTLWQQSASEWLLFYGLVSAQTVATKTAIYKATSPVALLLWALINGLASERSLMHLHSIGDWPTLKQIAQLQKTLALFCQQHPTKVEAEALLRSEEHQHLLVIGNLHQDPMAWDRRLNLMQVERGNEFHCFGQHQANFFADLTVIRLSSWGQLTLDQYSGADAAIAFYQHYRSQIGCGRVEYQFFGGVNETAVKQQFIHMLAKWQTAERTFDAHRIGFECRRSGDQLLLLRFAEQIHYRRFPDLESALVAFIEQSAGLQPVRLEVEYWPEREASLPARMTEDADLIQIECFIWPEQKAEINRSRATNKGWRTGIRLPSGHLMVFHSQQSKPALICHHLQHFLSEQNRLLTEASPGCDWWTFYIGQWQRKQLKFRVIKPETAADLRDVEELKAELSSATLFTPKAIANRAWLKNPVRFSWKGQQYWVTPSEPLLLIPLIDAIQRFRKTASLADYPIHVSSISFRDTSSLSMPMALLIKQKLEILIAETFEVLKHSD